MTTARRMFLVFPCGVMLAAMAFFLSYADYYLFSVRVVPIPGTYVFLAALCGWAAMIAVECVASPDRTREVMALYASHLTVLGALLAIVVCTVAFALLPTAYWDDGPMYLLYPPYDAAVVILSMLLAVHAVHRLWMRSYLIAALITLTASVAYDAWHPGTFSILADRAAGFAANPNITGFVAVLLCASILDFDRFRITDGIWLTLTGATVFLTLSRGDAILFLLEFSYYAYRTVRVNVRRHPVRLLRSAFALGVLVIVVVAAGMFLVQRADIFALRDEGRLTVVRGNSSALTDDDGRIAALQIAWERATESPVIGYGTGYSYSLGLEPHNIYLQQWLNNGLPGLLAYVFLIAAVARTFWRRRYPKGLLFITLVMVNGIFSHNILEERAFLCPLGILLTSSFYERHPRLASRITHPTFSRLEV